MMNIPLNQLICDVTERTFPNLNPLLENLEKLGQVDPILVEGPDKEGCFYIIDGARRFRAMQLRPAKFKFIKCIIYRNVTTVGKRNHLRIELLSTFKRPSRIEQQFMYELLQDADKMKLSKELRKKLEKGSEVPISVREKTKQSGASQEAMIVFYHLPIRDTFKNKLFERLWVRELTNEHARAIKRLLSIPQFIQLNDTQKEIAINTTIEQTQFKEQNAISIIEEIIMKDKPTHGNADAWTMHVSSLIKYNTELINNEIYKYMSSEGLDHLRACLHKLEEKIKLIEKNMSRSNKPKINTNSKPRVKTTVKIRGKEVNYYFINI